MQALRNIKTINEKKIVLLAEKVENIKEMKFYSSKAFSLFQGYHIGKPEVLTFKNTKDAEKMILLELVNIIRRDEDTNKLESHIKKSPELSHKLITYISNHAKTNEQINSIVHAITLLGRKDLLKWLILYLYSEMSGKGLSEDILKKILSRAEAMSEKASPRDRETAYMIGMYSMLDMVFETPMKEILEKIKVEKDITNALINNTGKYAGALNQIKERENRELAELILKNANALNTTDLMVVLAKAGISV